jgi:hypothetical protein
MIDFYCFENMDKTNRFEWDDDEFLLIRKNMTKQIGSTLIGGQDQFADQFLVIPCHDDEFL